MKDFDHYALNCVACLKNRFAFPDKRNMNSPLADIDYAYHFDASLFARFLRGESEERGVKRIEGRIVEVIQNPESGFVERVKLTRRPRGRRRPLCRLLGHARTPHR